jgi:hypothetical protein
VFLAVLAWTLFWKGLVPLLALPFRTALAAHRQRNVVAIKGAPDEASAAGNDFIGGFGDLKRHARR